MIKIIPLCLNGERIINFNCNSFNRHDLVFVMNITVLKNEDLEFATTVFIFFKLSRILIALPDLQCDHVLMTDIETFRIWHVLLR